jgi:hypothetical protein
MKRITSTQSATFGWPKKPWGDAIAIRQRRKTKRAASLQPLVFLVYLAPRPGLEPGTYGLTVCRYIYIVVKNQALTTLASV